MTAKVANEEIADCFKEGMTKQETAEKVGLSMSALHARMQRNKWLAQLATDNVRIPIPEWDEYVRKLHKRVGYRLALAREHAGLTRLGLANRIGMCAGTLGKYEQGSLACRISLAMTSKLAEELGVTTEFLTSEDRPLPLLERDLNGKAAE